MKKRMVSLLLALAMVMGLSATAFASEINTTEKAQWLIKYDEGKNVYLENSLTGEKAVRAIRFDEQGNPYDVDLITYAAELNALSFTDEIPLNDSVAELSNILPMSDVIGTRYEERYSYHQTGEKRKVTPNIRGGSGGATVSYGDSITIEESFSGGISFSGPIKDLIRAEASFSWNNSLSTSASFNVTFNIPAGQTGYVAFFPQFLVTEGTLFEYRTNSSGSISEYKYSVTGKSPVKLDSGFADGTYMLILT